MNTAEEKIRIVFTGDISFSGYFRDRWKEECLTSEVKAFLKCADHVVGNVECPLTSNKISAQKAFNHVTDPAAGRFLADMNIRIWNMANNHIKDCGSEGVLDSLEVAKKNNCQVIGIGKNKDDAFRPAILGENIKVGLLSLADGAWKSIQTPSDQPGAAMWSDKERLKKAISTLRESVDWVVMVLHGGDEHSDIALPHVRRGYISFLDMGADVIVAHHPHVVQQYEHVGNKLIVYSLGNFIFDTENQRDFYHTENGILLGIDFQKTDFTFDYMATCIDRKNQVVKKGSVPAVFRQFEKAEYAVLWPMVAKILYPLDLKLRKKNSLKLREMSPVKLFFRELITCRRKKYRVMMWGRICSLKGDRNKSHLKEVCDYLMDQA